MNETIEESYSVKVVKDGESGAVLSRAWFNATGEEHNLNGPALIKYESESGAVIEQTWMVDGLFHRSESEGPAVISYDLDAGTRHETYFRHNRPHRLNGPAIAVYDENTGQVLHQKFIRNGIPYKPEMKPVKP